jgi:hypothetical protein
MFYYPHEHSLSQIDQLCSWHIGHHTEAALEAITPQFWRNGE